MFITLNSFSQIYLKPTLYPSTPGNADGAIKFELVNYSGQVTYDTFEAGYSTDLFFPDSVAGLDFSLMDIQISSLAIDPLTNDIIAETHIWNPVVCKSVDVSYLLQPLTSSSCDGIVFANFEQDTVAYNGDIFMDFGPFQISNPNGVWDNQCSGKTGLNISNAEAQQFMLYMDVILEPANVENNTTFNATIFSTVSSEESCTATSYVNTVGSTAPFSYSWDYAAFTSESSQENLCQGIHNVRIVDNLSDTLSLTYVVVDSSNVFLDEITNPIIDTISFNTQNCSFDYNLDVDSTEMNYYALINDTTFYFELNIWQQGILTQVSDTVICHYSPVGYNIFSLSLYCLLKNSGPKVFQIIKVIDMSSTAKLYYSEKDIIKVYPNPVNDILSIEHPQFEYCELYSLNGQLIFTSQLNDINVSNVDSGIYFLNIHTSDLKTSTKKIVVN